MTAQGLLLTLELLGVFAFALDGALTAMRATTLDLFGVVALGVVTAVGGGILRDVLLGELPPASLRTWYYLATATAGALLAFGAHRLLARLTRPILLFDTVGLSLFSVTGAQVAYEAGASAGSAVLLGGLTGVGGGTLRDVLVRRVPSILTGGLYAVPALLAAAIAVLAPLLGAPPLASALVGGAVCAGLRLGGVLRGWQAPRADVARGSLDE
ncbi:trimeric intracellular cation channel family protein [Kineococcus sp. T13]|uniref:TRIC cation channel family protein n=1 Tax=Kineococcus vitellinus TaxID=2696565 RepID=UPI001411CE65|nr:trimeric intracellular cation channel family protein [Kineococcus vitellinus]